MLALAVTELNEPVIGLYVFTLMGYLEKFQLLFLGLVLRVEPEYGVGDGQYQGYAQGYSEEQLRNIDRTQFE